MIASKGIAHEVFVETHLRGYGPSHTQLQQPKAANLLSVQVQCESSALVT